MKKINSSNLLFLMACIFPIWKAPADEYLRSLKRPPDLSYLHLDMELRTYISFGNYTTFNEVPVAFEASTTEDLKYIAFADYKIGFSYLPSSWIELHPFITAQSHYSDPFFLPFQINEAGIAVKGIFKGYFLSLYPEIQVNYPIFRQLNEVERIITNDRALKLTPTLRLDFSLFKVFTPFAKIGLQYRNSGLSSLSLWQVGFSYQKTAWQVGFLTGGFQSIISDVDQHTPQKKYEQLNKFNLGSLKFYSVNPSAIGMAFWGNFLLGANINLNIQYNFDILGTNYAKGHSLYINIIFSVLNRNYKKKYKRSLHKFNEYQDESIESMLSKDPDKKLLEEIKKLQ